LNRAELQRLSSIRIEDAAELLAAKRWSAAYYLSGYALECALKSCVLVRVERTGIIFEDKKFVEKCWTHELETLVEQADLMKPLGLDISANPQIGTNWLIAKDWSVDARYHITTQSRAEDLFNAISATPDGVLQWVKKYW
jgi:hypothetical protein